MPFDIDIVIFIGFFTANLLFGLLCSRGIKTIKAYAVGDGNFSIVTIASTIVATWVSGQFFLTIISDSYAIGIGFITIVLVGDFLSLLVVGVLFAPRMAEFLGDLSIANAMVIV